MTDTLQQTDPIFGLAQAMLGNACRLSATLGEMRRDVLQAHLKAMEDQLQTCKATLAKVSEAKDWETVQASFARAASDQAEHQTALAREYGKIFADGMSSWLEECRACGDQWLAMDRLQVQPGNGSAFAGMSNAFTEFYERMGMALTPNGKLVEPGKAVGSTRTRPVTHQAA